MTFIAEKGWGEMLKEQIVKASGETRPLRVTVLRGGTNGQARSRFALSVITCDHTKDFNVSLQQSRQTCHLHFLMSSRLQQIARHITMNAGVLHRGIR